jgi:hypothetical protein
MASVREAERARKFYERAAATEEKERKRLYLEAQLAEVEAMNEELAAEVATLERLLASPNPNHLQLRFRSCPSTDGLPTQVCCGCNDIECRVIPVRAVARAGRPPHQARLRRGRK